LWSFEIFKTPNQDDVTAHKNPKGLDKSIDKTGVLALKNWYSDDIKFISLCKEIMANKNTADRLKHYVFLRSKESRHFKLRADFGVSCLI